MATERDRAHLRAIADYEARANAESIAEDAVRTPGRNIELGLQLSQFAASAALQLGAPTTEAPAVSLSAIWRALQLRKEPE